MRCLGLAAALIAVTNSANANELMWSCHKDRDYQSDPVVIVPKFQKPHRRELPGSSTLIYRGIPMRAYFFQSMTEESQWDFSGGATELEWGFAELNNWGPGSMNRFVKIFDDMTATVYRDQQPIHRVLYCKEVEPEESQPDYTPA